MKEYFRLVNQLPRLFRNEDSPLQIILDKEKILAWQSKRKKELSQLKDPSEWAEIGILFDDPYLKVIRDLVRFPSGRLGGYNRIINSADLEGGRGAAILPMFEGEIVLLHQFRHPTRSWHYEIPRGFGEPNLSPEENAKQEILEEIEGTIEELIPLGGFHTNTGIEGNNVALYFAKLSDMGSGNQDEGIESIKLLEVEDFEKWIRDGLVTDGFTLAAYARAKLRNLI